MNKIFVEQLENKNQFVISINNLKCFQSYSSLIAEYNEINRSLVLHRDWDYSKTTLKHLYLFIYHYAYYIKKDSILYNISNILENAKNKKQKIVELIKKGIIEYS